MELALQDFYNTLPDKPRIADADAGKILNRIMDKDLAVQRGPYIQLATNKRYYIVFDLDYPGAGAAWIDAGMPAPTICITNPENWHAQYLYQVPPVLMPIHGNYAPWLRLKPIALMKALQIAGTTALDGDMGFNGVNIKNPLHKSWITKCPGKPYTMYELAEYFLPDEPTLASTKALQAYAGRNCELFDVCRVWAYREVRHHKEYLSFADAVWGYCCAYNEMQFVHHPWGILNTSNVRCTARSIANFTWPRRNKPWIKKYQKNFGVLGFEPLDKKLDDEAYRIAKYERKAAGANHTNHRRQQNTERNIRAAVRRLHADGKRISKAAVAREAGVSRPTVHAYRHLLCEAV